MNIIEARSALFAFDGRLSRKQFLSYTLVSSVAVLCVATCIGYIPLPSSRTLDVTIATLLFTMLSWIAAALATKRARDIGWSPPLAVVTITLSFGGAYFLAPIVLSDQSISDKIGALLASLLKTAPEVATLSLFVMRTAQHADPQYVDKPRYEAEQMDAPKTNSMVAPPNDQQQHNIIVEKPIIHIDNKILSRFGNAVLLLLMFLCLLTAVVAGFSM